MRAYYNENDKNAAAWLRELIRAGLIADGDVDERSIEDVASVDLVGYSQCHFFAGIGGWSRALRLAGWPDDRPVWTGSCPCQPFSAAGKGGGFDDERHLWPAWYWLIGECHPVVVFGEQVASKAGLAWFDLVSADLEAAGYAVGAVNCCAAGVGAPHIRQRLWFVAESSSPRHERDGLQPLSGNGDRRGEELRLTGPGPACIVADADRDDWSPDPRQSLPGADRGIVSGRDSTSGGMVDYVERIGRKTGGDHNGGDDGLFPSPNGATRGFWRSARWLWCRDGKARPVEPGASPLVDGLSERVVRGGDSGLPFDPLNTAEARVMRLRGYGNAIVPQVAAEVIRAWLEVT